MRKMSKVIRVDLIDDDIAVELWGWVYRANHILIIGLMGLLPNSKHWIDYKAPYDIQTSAIRRVEGLKSRIFQNHSSKTKFDSYYVLNSQAINITKIKTKQAKFQLIALATYCLKTFIILPIIPNYQMSLGNNNNFCWLPATFLE